MSKTLEERKAELARETAEMYRTKADLERRRGEIAVAERHAKEERERAEIAAAKQRCINQETEAMAPLLGRTIVKLYYEGTEEGAYILTLDNGVVATFSSSGDDATYTRLDIEVPK